MGHGSEWGHTDPTALPPSEEGITAVCGAQVLDPALTRPGRLSRRVVVPLPDEAGRADILAVHLRKTPMLSDADKDLCRRQIAKISSKQELVSPAPHRPPCRAPPCPLPGALVSAEGKHWSSDKFS